MRRTPQTFGPAKMGDESTRIMVRRFKASAVPCGPASLARSPVQPACCRSYPQGVGYRQASSRDTRTAATAGREICAAGPSRYKQSIVDCDLCDVHTPFTYDPAFPKAAVFMGKTKCSLAKPYVPKAPAPPCCMKEGNVNTFFANNVPATPIGPAFGRCCGAPEKSSMDEIPCCENPN